MKGQTACPVCFKEFSSFLNLARHMVLSERRGGGHQTWLQSFLNMEFEEYAFGKDKAISMRLKAYCDKHGGLPELGAI